MKRNKNTWIWLCRTCAVEALQAYHEAFLNPEMLYDKLSKSLDKELIKNTFYWKYKSLGMTPLFEHYFNWEQTKHNI